MHRDTKSEITKIVYKYSLSTEFQRNNLNALGVCYELTKIIR